MLGTPAAQLAMGSHQLARRALTAMQDDAPIPGQMMMMLGQLVESTRTLGRDVQEMKQLQAATAARAEKDRETLRAEMTHVANRVDAVEDQLVAVVSSQNEMKKVTDKVNRWQWAGAGAIGVTSLFFTIIGWLLSRYWDRLFDG